MSDEQTGAELLGIAEPGDGPWDALSALQHDADPKVFMAEPVPRINVVTAAEIHSMLPEHLQDGVSLEWIHANVPGKRRIGKWNLWPTKLVLSFFNDYANDYPPGAMSNGSG